MRSLEGEQIIFPNSNLLDSRIRNYKRMTKHRVVFGFGVLYTTPITALERIPSLVKEIIQGIDQTRFVHHHLAAFGNCAQLRGGLLRPGSGLQPLYGHPAANQPDPGSQAGRAGGELRTPSRTLYVEGTGILAQVQLLEGGRGERPDDAEGDRKG